MRQMKYLLVVLVLSLVSLKVQGQNYTVHNTGKSYLGLLGGMNFSIPRITDRYSVLTSAEEKFEKEYDKFGKTKGAQFGLQYSYNFTTAIAVLIGVGYETLGFKYFTNYSWVDTLEKQEFAREMHHIQKISYFTVPIQAKWEITRGQFTPFVQGGVYMDFRHQATKIIHYDNTIDQEETENQLSYSPQVSIKEDTRKFNLGLTGGVGMSYHTKYATFGLESNFRYGFFDVVNDETRYTDRNGFALLYLDVLDQLKLSSLNVQASVSIPLNNAVRSNIMRKTKYYKKR